MEQIKYSLNRLQQCKLFIFNISYRKRKKSKRKILDTSLEDFQTFMEKEMLPKELRNINPNLLKLIPRATTTDNMQEIKQKKFDHKRYFVLCIILWLVFQRDIVSSYELILSYLSLNINDTRFSKN